MTIGQCGEIEEHRIERARFLGDRDRLHDVLRKASDGAHCGRETLAVVQARGDVDGGAVENAVSCGMRE